MSKLISYGEFADKVDDDDLEAFTRADLERFDYDPPKERVALLTWSVGSSRWCIVRGGDHREWDKMHTEGEMLFGKPPWRRSCVMRVFGRLGSVEAAVAAFAAPGADFEYRFVAPSPMAIEPSLPSGSRRFRSKVERAVVDERRWRRMESAQQGDLFSERRR